MDKKKFIQLGMLFLVMISIAIWTLLTWQHYHGGVPRHHIMANKELPSISNWWGALLIPLLTAYLLYRIQKRVFYTYDQSEVRKQSLDPVIWRFSLSLLFGILLSSFFTFGYTEVPGYMIMGLLPLAFLFPIYRAECLLGLVLSLSLTFGAVLPTVFGSILVLISLLVYVYLRSGILYFTSRLSHRNTR
jgi:hypothetical protein